MQAVAIENRRNFEAPTEDQGVYGISVAADIVSTGVQNLRLYERRGLVKPGRSAGGTRLYSADDIARLNRILNLLADGLNLAGIAMVLDLQDDNTRMRQEISIRPQAARRHAGHPPQ
jgi:MerR family transcriptional regulator, heat shock protein HspR